MNRLPFFSVILIATAIVTGWGQDAPRQSAPPFSVELICPGQNRSLEVGDRFWAAIRSVNGTIDTQAPLRIAFQVYGPDGLRIGVEESRIINQHCGDHRAPGSSCGIVPFDRGSVDWLTQDTKLRNPYDSLLNRPGLYKITGSSEGDLVRVKECSFTVAPSKLDALVFPMEIDPYELKGKSKAKNEPFDIYCGDYKSKAGGSVSVCVGITRSPDEALQNYDKEPSVEDVSYDHTAQLIVEFGQTISYLNDRVPDDPQTLNRFSFSWPSGTYVIQIGGYDQGNSEKAIVREFLTNYPSSLKRDTSNAK